MKKIIKEFLDSSELRTKENDTKISEIFQKIQKSELTNTDFQLLEKQLILNKKKLFYYSQLFYGILPNKIQINPNNSNFDLLVDNLNLFEQMFPDIKVEYYYFPSSVRMLIDTIFTIHNTIEITLPSGSFLRISPTKSESIEISFIIVEPINHLKGEGTLLMNIIIDYMTTILKYKPRLVLECNGEVFYNGKLINIGIKNQTTFFRKFGFRVENGKHYPHYVMMSSPKSEINLNEEQFKLAA
jgi:hypothetical protein